MNHVYAGETRRVMRTFHFQNPMDSYYGVWWSVWSGTIVNMLSLQRLVAFYLPQVT